MIEAAVSLQHKIQKKTVKLCVIGMGYVGLPLALEFAKRGFFVYGYDTNSARIEALYQGKEYITDTNSREILGYIKKGIFKPTTSPEIIKDSEVILICVPTPLRKVKTPNISYIIHASQMIRKYLHPPQLIILESTTYPGTSREVILPLLRKSGFCEERDFFLSFSPERIDPGNKRYPLAKIPKVVSGIGENSRMLTQLLYSKIIKKVVGVSSIETAETVKLLENTFRLVNIGLINEFAMLCSKLKISVWEVIEAAKTKPFGFMPFYPGPGIGGHCIPKDPLYLSWKAKQVGFKTKMIDLASFTNRYMPFYVVERIKQILSSATLQSKKILVLGVTYKRDVKDLRESPALDILELLKAQQADIFYNDPLIPYLDINGLKLSSQPLSKKLLKNLDCVILVTDHSGVDYSFLQKNSRVIFDTRNVYSVKSANIIKL